MSEKDDDKPRELLKAENKDIVKWHKNYVARTMMSVFNISLDDLPANYSGCFFEERIKNP